MNKKNIIVLTVVIIAVLLAGFLVYKYKYSVAPVVQLQNAGPVITTPQLEVQTQGSGLGTLSICKDKCGDGVCQTTDPTCTEDNSANCICQETPQDCPKDCK